MSKTVRDAMHNVVITVPSNATLPSVAQVMVRNAVHAVVVVDDKGEMIGVVSDLDMLAGEWLASDRKSLETMRTLQAGTLATSPVMTVSATAEVGEAVRRMLELKVHRLVVCSEDKPAVPVGILTESDIIKEMAV